MSRLSRASMALGTAIAAVLASPAFAQTSATPPEAETAEGPATRLDDIVVTGTRASTERAITLKRASNQIIDTVSASEIGQLPDFNAGDALKRLPGVGALLYQGEPRFLIIRGFNQTYNDILIDGFSLASTDINLGQNTTGGRQVSMEVLPSNLASHIDVVKSALPSTEANFIGGLANFVTNSAFDFTHDTISASVKGGVALDDKGNGGNHFAGQAEISGAKRFGSDRQFGLYLSATYWSRRINVPQVETGGTRNFYGPDGASTTPYGGTGYAVPSQRLYYNYQNKRERLGFQGRFDWRPSDTVSAYLSAYHFRQTEDSDRNDLNAAVQASARDLNQTPTSGTLTNVTQTMQLGRYRWRRNLSGLYGRFDAMLGGGWDLDGGASWSTSRVNNPQTVDAFAQTGLQYSYDTSGPVPLFTAANPAQANDATRYPSTMHREELYHLAENRYEAQLNLTRNMKPQDRGFGVGAGARYSAIRQNTRFDRTDYSNLHYTLADVLSGKTLCGFVCDTPIPIIDAGKADDLFGQGRAAATAKIDVAASTGGTYRTREDVAAGYVQAQYRADHWYVTGGVRIEHTDSGSNSTQATNGVYAPVSASNDYTSVLPSALAVIDTSDASKLRIGASMTVSRPNFGQFSLHGGVLTTTSNPPTLATGNPNLKPRRAINADIAHDWYLDGGHGVLSVAAFYKWIRDDIFTYGVLETVPGVGTPVLVTQARNTDKMVRDYGIELSASHDLTFLPAPFDGLGVSANATLSRAHFPITLSDGSTRVLDKLPDQASVMVNASIYYDKNKFHGRFAWNHLGKLWDDRFPNFTPAGFYANRYQQPTDNFDLQLSYDVTKTVSVSFDALNLSAQGMKYQYGRDQELLQSQWALPTQLLVGVRVKM